jgi:hypothetical protein
MISLVAPGAMTTARASESADSPGGSTSATVTGAGPSNAERNVALTIWLDDTPARTISVA